ncbi:outer membrane autotransporter protein [Methylohalomonas lacus]|uniref:Outer membrane autotransporter protein n=1 Tax=Methylohalomonas lacus TaxID=398773 RepID=A0AAE3HMQ7_9GAMM|nr:autotransporter outer membrane beta-barrel domain-containing protein [Methylohalomonas lacus]MCS3904021.1 outer membrane autotransporter protein [Methylohalomonas lacus]
MMTEYFHRMGQALQNRIRGGFFGGGGVAARGQSDMAGRAAGDGMADWGGWSPWVSYGRTSADNELSSTRYDATQDNVLFGIDYTYSDRLIFGISGGYENNDVTTAFNLGEMEVEGLTVAPYAAYLLTDNVSVDVAFGYSDLSIDQFRTEPGGAIVRGDTDASRWFVMSNLNANHQYRNWLFSGTAGVIYSEEDQDGFTETGGISSQTVASRNIEYGQLTFGGEIAYVEKAVEPYASLHYQYAFEDGDSTRLNPNQARRTDDDDEFRLATGLRFFANNGVSGVIEYNTILGRDHYDSHGINLIGRYQF